MFLFRFQSRRRWSIIFKLFVLSLLTINLIQTGISLTASHYNYPGADALLQLQTDKKCTSILFRNKIIIKSVALDDSTATVHIDVYAAENGVSRFLEMNSWM